MTRNTGVGPERGISGPLKRSTGPDPESPYTPSHMGSWWVYMVRCRDKSLYTGITKDLTRRVKEHNGKHGESAGAAYTRARRPVILVYWNGPFDGQSLAASVESKLKRQSKSEKELMIQTFDHGTHQEKDGA